jgi:hypothetical protein
MTALLPMDEWLEHLQGEYLDRYVRGGGAAVKFAVPCDGSTTGTVLGAVEQNARRADYLVVKLDAATTRIHLMDRLFFAIADQIDWDDLVLGVLEGLAASEGFRMPPVVSRQGLAGQLATANEADEDYVRMVVTKRVQDAVFKDRTLAKDFRVAMAWLCQARLNGGDEGAMTTTQITEWLTGQVSAISAMKPYQIFTKVNRTNARYLLESLLAWVIKAGKAGTLVLLDAERLLEKSRVADGTVNYTKSSLLDAYEVLRQFIDSTDDLTATLIVVSADERLLDTEVGSRGIASYQALKNRIYDEVRDREHPNPMASLVRLSVGGSNAEVLT